MLNLCGGTAGILTEHFNFQPAVIVAFIPQNDNIREVRSAIGYDLDPCRAWLDLRTFRQSKRRAACMGE